ncbi:MAG: hypothetical protein ACRD3N_18475 [Terracidiphilus sp.]
MHIDPIEDWRRLTQHYGAMLDEELRNLAADFGDLTLTAQQALRDEMRKRGLGDPQSPAAAARTEDGHAALRWGPAPAASGERSPADQEDNGAADEYTWKTLLCECETGEQALQISEMLRRAGIESWVDARSSFLPDPTLASLNPQVLVAADEFDRAREIAAQPIPQEIVELSKIKPEDYEPPVCPGCGTADPVLEGVDPVNAWHCESCGREWSEAGETG